MANFDSRELKLVCHLEAKQMGFPQNHFRILKEPQFRLNPMLLLY